MQYAQRTLRLSLTQTPHVRVEVLSVTNPYTYYTAVPLPATVQTSKSSVIALRLLTLGSKLLCLVA